MHCIISHADFLVKMLDQDGAQLQRDFDDGDAVFKLEATEPLLGASFPLLNCINLMDCGSFSFHCDKFYPKNWNLDEVTLETLSGNSNVELTQWL